MLKSGTKLLILHSQQTEYAPRLSPRTEIPRNRNEEPDSSSGGPAFRCLALGVFRTRQIRTTCLSEASGRNRGPTGGVLGLLTAIESDGWCDGISRLERGACRDGLRLREPKHALGRHRGLSTGKLECQLLPLVGTIMIAGQRERQPKRCARHQSDRPPRSRPVQQNEIS
jgi:hypothetical protein